VSVVSSVFICPHGAGPIRFAPFLVVPSSLSVLLINLLLRPENKGRQYHSAFEKFKILLAECMSRAFR